MFIESVIILEAAIAQVAGDRLSGQPALFRDSGCASSQFYVIHFGHGSAPPEPHLFQ
jgi:hypothetical protein